MDDISNNVSAGTFNKSSSKKSSWRGGSWRGRGGGRKTVFPNSPTGPSIKKDSHSLEKCPFKGWRLYFITEEYSSNSDHVKKIRAIQNYIERNPNKFYLETIIEKKAGTIDVKQLKSNEDFLKEWDTFEEDLVSNSEQSIACMGIALHQTIFDQMKSKQLKYTQNPHVEVPPLIKLRPIHHEPISQFKDLKVNFYGKLVSVRGTVIRCNAVKSQCTQVAYKCLSCSYIQEVYQPEGVLTSPSTCPTALCRSKKFSLLLADAGTKTVDWQVIKLQEICSGEQMEGGRVPRSIEVDLVDDLVGSCIPGDDVIISGVLKVQYPEGNRDTNLFLLQINAVSLVNEKNQLNTTQGKHSISGIEFSVQDYYAVQKIHAEEGLVRLLVQSLCSKIFGQEIVKLGLLLALFSSGCEGARSDCRYNSHILLVGDPGLGKSQLLEACVNAAPRGVYVCGNTSTTAGLSVSLIRESGGEFAIEAGALVLADQGICCIDEFDKMSSQHQALLEAMEQQTISIAKAGVVCTLNARCSIFAAANPQGGHYNKAKTVAENIKLSSALLSRFDLVFILLDQPDPRLDQLLSEHVLALHSTKRNDSSRSGASGISNNTKYDPEEPLKERLQLGKGESLDLIPLHLLRKYIAYANKYVRCRLSPAAGFTLRNFYTELRKRNQCKDGTPVVPRQLQAMVRLTQARARMELREMATEQDALDVVEVVRHSLIDSFSDNNGQLDFSRSLNGSGVSNRGQTKKFLKMLYKYSEQYQNSLFETKKLKQLAMDIKIPPEQVGHIISSLNLEGFLIKKDMNLYQLIVVD